MKKEKYKFIKKHAFVRAVVFWLFFPISFPVGILVWLSYYTDKNSLIGFSDYVDSVKYFYFMKESMYEK